MHELNNKYSTKKHLPGNTTHVVHNHTVHRQRWTS